MCQRPLFTFSLDTWLASSHYSGLSLNVKSTERPLGLQSTLPFVHLVKSLVHRLVYFLSPWLPVNSVKLRTKTVFSAPLHSLIAECLAMRGGLGTPHLPLHTHHTLLHSILELGNWHSLTSSIGFLDFWCLIRVSIGRCRQEKRDVCFLFSAPSQLAPSLLVKLFYPKPQLQSLALSWR